MSSQCVIGMNSKGSVIAVVVIGQFGGVALAAKSQLNPFGLIDCDNLVITDFINTNEAQAAALKLIRSSSLMLWPSHLVRMEGF